MKSPFLVFVLLLIACDPSPTLKEGEWTGSLTPMNHPDMENPITYDVDYKDNNLTITLNGPGGTPVSVRDPRIEGDTLYFAFNEPEQQALLECALAKNKTSGFTGRCTDASGQWARFTMIAPE